MEIELLKPENPGREVERPEKEGEMTERERDEMTEREIDEMKKLKNDVEAIRKNAEDTLAKIEKLNKGAPSKSTIRKAVEFVATTAASAIIFLKVADMYSGFRKSTTDKKEKKQISKLQQFFLQIGKITTAENVVFQRIAKWCEDNKNVDVKLSGWDLKLVSMFENQYTEVSKALAMVEKDTEELDKKIKDPVSWNVVTLADAVKYREHSTRVIELMRVLYDDAEKGSKDVPESQDLVDILGNGSLDNLDKELTVLNDMPI